MLQRSHVSVSYAACVSASQGKDATVSASDACASQSGIQTHRSSTGQVASNATELLMDQAETALRMA